MTNIHNTCIVDKNSRIANNVQIGPYSIIEENVIIDEGTIIYPYVHIKSGTSIGKYNKIFQNSIIGEDPQDLKYNAEETFLEIGNNNIIREFCTLNRGTDHLYKTVIGSNCLFMAYAHVAHDCIVQDKVILANGVQLGGHVDIGYHATVGGMSPIHQFCKVGDHSFIGGGRVALQDVPPYILATGEPLQFSGINSVGLRRRDFKLETRNLIKKAYKYIYRSKLNMQDAVLAIKENLNQSEEIINIINFVKESERGII